MFGLVSSFGLVFPILPLVLPSSIPHKGLISSTPPAQDWILSFNLSESLISSTSLSLVLAVESRSVQMEYMAYTHIYIYLRSLLSPSFPSSSLSSDVLVLLWSDQEREEKKRKENRTEQNRLEDKRTESLSLSTDCPLFFCDFGRRLRRLYGRKNVQLLSLFVSSSFLEK